MPLPKEQFLPSFAKAELAGRAADLKAGGVPELLRKAGKEMYDNPVVNTAISLSPGAGDIQAAAEALRSAREGDWTGAALNGIGVLPFVPALAGTFVGKGSRTWDSVQASEALKRIESGEDAAKVWKETGYGAAPWDKMARSEVPDNAASFKLFPMDREVKLDSALSHKELSSAYPEVFSETRMNYASPSRIPGFNGSLGKNALGEDLLVLSQRQGLGPEGKSTTIHELQHAVQGKEGFAKGGTPEMFYGEIQAANDEIKKVNKQMGSIVRSMDAAKVSGDKDKYDRFRRMYDEAMDYKLSELVPKAIVDPDDQYRRLAGEAEARLTQARINMTPEERLAQYPYDPKYFEEATGVPLEKLISRFDKGPQRSLERNGNPIVEALRNSKAAPRAEEFEEARKEGVRLLGLPENNTAMDRAKAMGYDLDVYHGTGGDITAFDNSKLGKFTNARTAHLGTFTTDNPILANSFANQENGNVMPLLMKRSADGKEPLELGYRTAKERGARGAQDPFHSMQEAIARKSGKPSFDDVTKEEVKAWRDSVSQKYGSINLLNTATDSNGFATARSIAEPYHNFHIAFEPSQLRSRFAAFNPAKADSTNILAGVGAGGLGMAAALRALQEEEQYQ